MDIRFNPDMLPPLLASIQQSQQNESTASQQLATGLSVNQLSDDPAAVASLVSNHDQAGQDDQFLQNISTVQGRFQVADSALSNVVTLLTQAISVGTEGANGTMSAADRQPIAQEVQGLQSQLASLANTTYQGTYLFAGTAVSTQPFTVDAATNTVTYYGNNNTSNVQLSNGNFIPGNVPGSQLFMNGAGSAFGALGNLITALTSGNNIPAAVGQVQDALSQVSIQRVLYGNGLNQMNLSDNFLNQDKINLSTQQNALVGANPATAASDLAQAEVANQSLLSATGRILAEPTLLDFINPG